jgi:micrococcal nuclease
MSRRATAVTLAVLVALAGCGVAVTGPDGEATTTGDGVATTVEAGSLVPDASTSVGATVVDVVDGDTLDVRYPNGTTDTVRLLGIDTPEVRGDNDPGEFEGVPDTAAGRECLRSAGDDASDALARRLAGTEVRLAVDRRSDRRDRYDRLLAYVIHEGRNVNYWLVASGHARVYDSDFRYAQQFYAAEGSARREGRRLWSCSDGTSDTTTDAAPVADSPLAIAEIHADAAENDHENLDDEYLVFRNAGKTALDLSGWRVADAVDHTYTFPQGTVLSSGKCLTLHTGESDYRIATSVIRRRRSATPSSSPSRVTRHRQLPLAVPGRLNLASLPSPSRSGTVVIVSAASECQTASRMSPSISSPSVPRL